MEEIVREVGVLTQDDQLVRGVLTIGAAALTVLLTAWRVLRPGKAEPRVKIDVPATVRVSVEPVRKDSQLVPGLAAGKIVPVVHEYRQQNIEDYLQK